MAEQTLLEMTQNVLQRLDSDSVNSISDTVESLQVANIIKNKYYDILARANLPEQQILFQLVASGSVLKPTLMTTPAGTSRIDWVKYFNSDTTPDVTPGYLYVTALPMDQFLDMVNRFNPDEANVGSFTFTEGSYSFTFYYKNDRQPSYCTVIENKYVLFDSYDNTLDSTLQASKTLTYGQIVTPFVMTDTFVPDLDDNQFPLLVNEATALAFYELKQMPHVKAEQEIKRQWSVVQKNKSVSNKPSYFDQLADFGRIPRTGGYSSGGYGAYRWMRQAGP